MAAGSARAAPAERAPVMGEAPGLQSAVVAGFLISALGGSRVRTGPVAAFIAVVFPVIGAAASPPRAITGASQAIPNSVGTRERAPL